MGIPYIEPAPVMGSGGEKVEWKEYWRSIKKRLWMIVLATVVITVATAAYAWTMQPIYRSTATLLIESAKAKILSIDEVYSGVSQDREYYQTQVEILRSRDVALRAVQATSLWERPGFDPRVQPTRWSRWTSFASGPEAPQPSTPAALAEATVGKFSDSLSVEPVRLSQLVKVSFEATDAQVAADMANATAQAYINADHEAIVKMTQQVNGLLEDRMSALRDKLLQSEQALQAFREKEHLVSLGGSSQSVAGQQVGEVTQRLISARVRRTELESAQQQVQSVKNGDYSTIPLVMTNAGVSDARNRVTTAAVKLDELSNTLGSEHSRVKEARGELAAAQRSLQSQTQTVIASMTREYQAARDTERALEGALGSARGNVQELNRQEFQLGVLEREVQANKQLYELFLSRAKETAISSNLQTAVARIVDAANPYGGRVRPHRGQMVVIALLLSLAGGMLAAVLLDKLDNTLKGTDEAEQRLRQPVLATLPAISTKYSEPLTRMFLDRPMSQHAEAIRTARTGVLMSNVDVRHKILLVTSSVSGEGKTTLCTNLAFAHAQTKRTLLIDADMRNPQIGQRLGLPFDAKGLSNLVSGTASAQQCVHAIEGSSLMVMPAGDIPLNPQELLLSNRFRDALASLSKQIEIIVFDSPPLDKVSDALVIAPLANDTIYVVKAGHTPHTVARRGIDRLQRAGAKILGVVLNNLAYDTRREAQQADAESRFVEPLDSTLADPFAQVLR